MYKLHVTVVFLLGIYSMVKEIFRTFKKSYIKKANVKLNIHIQMNSIIISSPLCAKQSFLSFTNAFVLQWMSQLFQCILKVPFFCLSKYHSAIHCTLRGNRTVLLTPLLRKNSNVFSAVWKEYIKWLSQGQRKSVVKQKKESQYHETLDSSVNHQTTVA